MSDQKNKNILNTKILNIFSSKKSDRANTENNTQSNKSIAFTQIKNLAFVIILTICLLCAIFYILKLKTSTKEKIEDNPKVKIDLPDKSLDPEKHWRNHFEESRTKDRQEFEERIKHLEQLHEDSITKSQLLITKELADTKIKLDMAQRELTNASLELRKSSELKDNSFNDQIIHNETNMALIDYEDDIEFDEPKSAMNYIPEGTYFTGYLLGGIVVSTALNTPDTNAPPVSIRLTQRGNLSPLNDLNISKCRIMGSCYGDLSSERAIVRLEKMICEEDGMYTTSKIAGQIFGHDGYNGIKGTVISTSSKHIKNAMVGGIISGLTSSAKTSESGVLSSAGVVSTSKTRFTDNLKQGGLQGVANAGEKLTDYYLRQAESMSPVLTIPSGTKVNVQITEGFYVGEIGTHKKIEKQRNNKKVSK